MRILPIKVDKTPSGVITKKANIGEKGYSENTEYTLTIHPTNNGFVAFDYYGEDDSNLNPQEVFEIFQKATELI